jgi:putative FmdB family regulatory protein
MPLYEYLCGACGHRFERIQKFSDAPIDTCPACGKNDVQKLLSAPAIQFKGTGWYVTDYAGKKGDFGKTSSTPGPATSSGSSASGSSNASSDASSSSSKPSDTGASSSSSSSASGSSDKK